MSGRNRVERKVTRYHRLSEQAKTIMYHYTESGLDNVYLTDGFTIHETPYGEGISIKNTDALHKAIGRFIIKSQNPVTGAELRFLRLEMGLGQKKLADLIGTTEQTLRLWEKHRKKPLSGPADRLMRALYAEYVSVDGSVRRMVDRLAQIEETEPTRVQLCTTRTGWKVEDATS